MPSPGPLTPSGRVVVTLSSVAKTPPPLNINSGEGVAAPGQLPPLSGASPAKAISREEFEKSTLLRAPQMQRVVEVKLPPKNAVLPKLTKLGGGPVPPAAARPDRPFSIPPSDKLSSPSAERKVNPPPMPAPKEADGKAVGPRRVPAFKLKPFRFGAPSPGESIFANSDAKKTTPGWKHLEAGELPPPEKEASERSPVSSPVAPADAKAANPVAPPAEVKSDIQVAPPLVSAPAAESAEKLRPPPGLPKGEEDDSSVAKAPALAEPVRQLAPPFPAGAVRKTIPPPSPNARGATPPPLPLPGLVSALRKTGPVPDAPQPTSAKEEAPLKEAPLKSVPENVPNSPVSSPAKVGATDSLLRGVGEAAAASSLTQTELPIAAARSAGHPPALPTENPEEKKINVGPKISTTVTPSSRQPKPGTTEEKIQFPPQVTEPPPPVGPKGKPAKSVALSALPGPESSGKTPVNRAARLHKRRLIGTIVFYVIFLAVVAPTLFFLGLHFGSETTVEGQVIPPPGTLLNDEVWIVTDFRELASGIADDLAAERAPKLQEIQERQDHVQRAQADIAAREERIRLLQEQMQAARDEINTVIKQAHDSSQKIWDGPGAALEDEYKTKLSQLQETIAARAKSLNLKYTPDDTYQSPEVWANAYRLALYETPPGVDGTKEHQWIEDQITAWRAFTKSYDDRKEKLRQQAAQLQIAPASQVTDVNDRIEDLQHRVDSTQAEEDPLKTELQQAQADLVAAQTAEASLDGKYYQQLYSLAQSIAKGATKTLPVDTNGRFTWSHLEKDSAFSEGEKNHDFWIFALAVRKDGLQYWVLTHFSVEQNSVLPILIEPSSFVSTKAILRPDLPPDQQQ